MAADAEVIKTYVRNGMGIGIVARMAYDKAQDQDLAVIDVGNLFDSSVTSLAIRKNAVLREYVYEFIQLFASHLNRDVVDQAMKAYNDTSLQEKLYQEFVKEAAMRWFRSDRGTISMIEYGYNVTIRSTLIDTI